MDFLKRIKTALFDEHCRYQRGMPRGKTIVDSRDLIILLEHFESLDSKARSNYPSAEAAPLEQRLNWIIKEMWHQNGKQADQIMMVFSQLIADLVNEKMQQIPRFK